MLSKSYTQSIFVSPNDGVESPVVDTLLNTHNINLKYRNSEDTR